MPLIRCLSVVQGEEVAFGEAVEEIVQVFLVVFELFEASCGLLRERWAFGEVREELFATPGSGVKVFEEGALAARGEVAGDLLQDLVLFPAAETGQLQPLLQFLLPEPLVAELTFELAHEGFAVELGEGMAGLLGDLLHPHSVAGAPLPVEQTLSPEEDAAELVEEPLEPLLMPRELSLPRHGVTPCSRSHSRPVQARALPPVRTAEL